MFGSLRAGLNPHEVEEAVLWQSWDRQTIGRHDGVVILLSFGHRPAITRAGGYIHRLDWCETASDGAGRRCSGRSRRRSGSARLLRRSLGRGLVATLVVA